ncbi:MAG: WYL domain-containing protein [Paraperlucidibaca sp.]|nr:WYL domain-containing protein [Paraperlucidibaca sp.]MBQ0722697.1 WYL domain-containing protein [Paraperlucidibaca sp.]MBQ0843125.1 WYL domain-containing protein [Paraperlucidibaca sp.]
MTRMIRLHMIDQLLSSRAHVTLSEFLDALEVSQATFKRDLEFLRDQLNAPIVYDRDINAYRFERRGVTGPKYELPGLWLDSSEAYALLTATKLLENIEPGLLGPQIAPLKSRLKALLSAENIDPEAISKRVRLIQNQRRLSSTKHFQKVARATLDGLRLVITHLNRNTGERTEREISPQRLTHYRENWYVEAWCHTREAIRSFGFDAIESVTVTPHESMVVPDADLDAVLGTGYGIFNGAATQWATLRFSPARAQWVSKQVWHEQQRSAWLPDGSYQIELPYNDDRELINDILSYGADVVVLGPMPLRLRILDELCRTAKEYE